jgi:glycosyltransferase involved in cell wall biosynthesis
MNMNQFKNLHKGKRCFILGNGPSLNDIDLSLLKDEITFGTNRIYLSGFVPNYYVCVNPLVLKQFEGEIDALDTTKFISGVNLDTSLREPVFSSPEGPIWEGYTVTYVALQLAYYMGFEEVILIGVDHDFGPGGLQGQPNQQVTGGDTGHFHPDYFKGAEWNLPDLQMSEFAYSLARQAYEKAGRRVVNASTRTKLRVFPLVNFNHIIKDAAPRVSAIVSAYKCADILKECLEDLEAQTERCEVVIVCQEGSEELRIALQRPHRDSYLCLTPDIPTLYDAWNIGIKAAHGKYITNANSDDRHHPRAYEIMANILDGRPDIDLVYHNSFITWEDKSYAEFVEQNQNTDLVPGREVGKPGYFAWADYSKGALARGCFIGPHPMWRRSLHQTHGYFNVAFKSAGDYDFWLRVAGERNFFHVPMFLGLYHANEHGIELGNPELSLAETVSAMGNNASPGYDVEPFSPGLLRVSLDGAYTFIEKAQFLEAAEWVKYT